MKFRRSFCRLSWSALACAGLACSSSEDDAVISVLLQSEDIIINGIAAGNDSADIRDGWNVEFQKYVVSVGNVELRGADESGQSSELYVVDLTQVSSSGDVFWTFDDLAEGKYEFHFSTFPDGATRHESVTQDDFDAMVDGNWTYLIQASMNKEGGVSCPPPELAEVPVDAEEAGENDASVTCYVAPEITFNLGVESETVYGPCEIDGIPGVTATSGSPTTVAVTIHGDHLFFNGFPEGDESGVTRLAQWWADADLNLDGEVTEDELKGIAPSDLAELDDRYQIGAASFDNMWEYLQAQVATQGHFQGEGACPAVVR